MTAITIVARLLRFVKGRPLRLKKRYDHGRVIEEEKRWGKDAAMRVYSLNKTIYRGNVERDFFLHCLRHEPRLLRYVPGIIWATLRYWFGALSRTGFWEAFHSYFIGLQNFEVLLAGFWSQQRLLRIKRLYLLQKRDGDIILTGAPDCLVEPLCRSLGLGGPIASVVDCHSGRYTGLSCHGAEKLQRFRRRFPQGSITQFWSASLVDRPVASVATACNIVRGGRLLDWENYEKKQGRWQKWLRTWISPEFFRFWCVGCVNMAASWSLEAIWSLMLPPNSAFAVGYAMSLLVSFALNSKVTFKMPLSFYRFWRFALSYIPNFLVQMASVFLLYNILHLPHLLCYFMAAIIGTPVTFLCLKFFAFRGGHTADTAY